MVDIQQRWSRFRGLLASQVDGASIAMFRIVFGLVMFAHAIKYLYPQHGTSLKNFLYHETTYNFTYPGLSWVQPFPEPLWTMFFGLMALAALGVALGVFYRVSAITLCGTYTYIFLTEVAKYNNHYYLMCLFALLLAAMPADRRFSIAAWWKSRTGSKLADPKTVPFWTVFLLRAQLFIVYFYGGIAKLDADWLTGIPMIGKGREILDFFTPVLGLPAIDAIYVGLFICWTGLIYDLTIGFLLVCRRTRWFGFGLVTVFHVCNHFLFPIGLFPIMAFATTLIFFEPDWPVRLFRWIRAPRFKVPAWRWAGPGLIAFPPIGFLLGWTDRISGFSMTRSTLPRWGTALIVCFLVVQVAFPLRHYFIAGDAKWTEEGQEFSWRMMLRSKDASHLIYHVVDTEMIQLDANGNMRFDWTRWPDEHPKTIYVPIECSRFNWRHHPGLTATYEPNVGLRPIYRLASGEDAVEKKQHLAEQWKRLFGRHVSVVDTIGFDEAFAMLEKHFADKGKRQAIEPVIERMRQLTVDAQLKTRSPLAREHDLASLGTEMEALLETGEQQFVRSILRRLHPFLTQGGSFPAERFLLIDDREMNANSREAEKITGGGEFLVWVDIGRLRSQDWKNLPQWFVTFENRELRVVWNFVDDLNDIQKRRFTTSPWMIRQFAVHIADRWESKTGRRPGIRVVSNVMMNYRIPQPLIDPNIDLASVDYRLFGHNGWILPLEGGVGGATRHARKIEPGWILR